MDKNTLIGFGLILLILVGFSMLQKPTEQKVQQAIQQDSIIQATPQQPLSQQTAPYEQELVEAGQTEAQALNDNYGQFAAFLTGENQIYNIENDLMVVSMASKGGRIASSGSKLRHYDSLPLILLDEKNSSFDITLISSNNRIINTKDLYLPCAGTKP